MTEDERSAAEVLGQGFALEMVRKQNLFAADGPIPEREYLIGEVIKLDRNAFIAGYAAACEAKRQKIQELEDLLGQLYDRQNG